MITSEQALSYQFQNAGMNGYRKAEVDEFVRAVAETLNFQEKKVRDMQRIIDELKKNENIIQTTLVNAQKLAMELTEEAKQKAETVAAEAQQQATGTLANAKAEAEATIAAARQESEQLLEQAKQHVSKLFSDGQRAADKQEAEFNAQIEHQRKILDAMKAEVAAFRSDILNRYKEQVTLIKDLPDTTPEPIIEVVPVEQPIEEVEVVAEVEVIEEDIPVVEVTPIENDAPAVGSDLLQLMNDMEENEAQAAAAVQEVASLTSETAEEPSLSYVTADEQNKQPSVGFRVLIDDEDEDDDEAAAKSNLSFGGRIQVDDDNQ